MKKLKFLSLIAIMILLTAPMALAAGQWSPLFTKKQPGGIYGVIDTSKTTGDIWYVDSGTGTDGAGYGRNPLSPTATLDYVIGLTTASNGDVIYVAAGHAESGSAANLVDIDKAGLRVEGLGVGANRPSFTFSDTDTTFAIGAANVTVKNIQFIAGVHAIEIGIAVEAAGTGFTLEDCIFPEPTTSSWEFIDAIDLEALVSGMTVKNCTFYNADATGGSHFLEAGNGVNTNIQLIDNYIYGEFGVACVWSNDTDLEWLIQGGTYTNLTNDQHALEFVTGTATGQIIDVLVRTNAQGTAVDPGSMTMSNVLWDDDTTADTVAIPVVMSTAGAGSIGAIDDATTDSIHGKIGTDSEMGDVSMYDQWILDQIDLDAILASVPSGMSYVAAVTTATDTTHTSYSALIGLGTNYFVNGWTMIVIWDANGGNAAPEGDVVDISAFNTTTGAVTHGAVTTLAENDKVLFVRDELVSIYQKALATPVTNSLAYRISQYIASGDGDFVGGTALASNVSLVDALGQNGADTTVAPDRNAAKIQERIDAITTVMQMVDAAGANGWEDDGSGGNLYTTFNSTDANANLFSGDGGKVKDDNVFSYFAQLERMSEEILSGMRASGKSVGNVWYVDSVTGAGGDDGSTWALAEATLAAGIADATASKGDVVFVAPAHAETVSAAITANIIGVTVIGLGTGSQMPTLTFNHASSSIDISVAGVTIQNLRLYNTTAATDNAISILAGGDYAVIDGIEFTDTGAGNFVHTIGILLASGADMVTVRNCSVYNTQSGATSFIDGTTGIVNRLLVENNDIWGDYSDAAINSDKALTNFILRSNLIRNVQAADHAVQLSGAATGYAYDNILTGTVPGAIFDPGSLLAFGNKIVESDKTDAPDNAWLEDGKWFYAEATFELDGAANTDNLFTVTGSVEVKVYGTVTETLTSHSDTIAIGTADSTTLLIAATGGDAPMTSGDTWTSATTAKSAASPTTYILDDDNIAITQSATNLADGTVVIHVYWRALTEGASVIPI